MKGRQNKEAGDISIDRRRQATETWRLACATTTGTLNSLDLIVVLLINTYSENYLFSF
jgi:hypothetical protein